MSNEWSGKRIRDLQGALSGCKTKSKRLNSQSLVVESKLKSCITDVEKIHHQNIFFKAKNMLADLLKARHRQLYIARRHALKCQISLMAIKVYRLLRKVLCLIKIRQKKQSHS